jgi:hypothetical protein
MSQYNHRHSSLVNPADEKGYHTVPTRTPSTTQPCQTQTFQIILHHITFHISGLDVDINSQISDLAKIWQISVKSY